MRITRRTRLAIAVPAMLSALATPAAMGIPAASAATMSPVAHGLDMAIAPQSVITARASLPVDRGYRTTGEFHDVSGLWSGGSHTGLDFADSTGTPIHAVLGGVVVSTGYEGSYGNKTVIRDADGTEWWFCHQDAFAVSVGDRVNAGEVIGYIGSTGNSTGPHLHLEVRPGGGDPVDPEVALEALGLTV